MVETESLGTGFNALMSLDRCGAGGPSAILHSRIARGRRRVVLILTTNPGAYA
jgi:hypothetical protein